MPDGYIKHGFVVLVVWLTLLSRGGYALDITWNVSDMGERASFKAVHHSHGYVDFYIPSNFPGDFPYGSASNSCFPRE